MTREEIKIRQREQRAKCLQAILELSAPKKLIVAGAGTGKTFTFARLIDPRKGGNNLAMTFIRKLVADMDVVLKGNAEVNQILTSSGVLASLPTGTRLSKRSERRFLIYAWQKILVLGAVEHCRISPGTYRATAMPSCTCAMA